jgi:hypothetical protein
MGQVFNVKVQHSAQVMGNCVEEKVTIASKIPKSVLGVTMLILNYSQLNMQKKPTTMP